VLVISVFALKYPYLPSNIRICPHISVFATGFNFRYLRSSLEDFMSKYKERWCIKIWIKSYFNQINTFQYIGITRFPYQARQWSWRADIGRGLMPGTIWKISCHNLFITYYTLTFSKHWLLYCKKDLWTDKLRK
jgi:hypothetical protein